MKTEFEPVHNAVGTNLDLAQTLPFQALKLQKYNGKSNAGLKKQSNFRALWEEALPHKHAVAAQKGFVVVFCSTTQ
jgi:hypothetical protein